MRLQLIGALAAAAAALGGRAHADTGFTSKLQVYTDDDHTQVVSPVVEAQSDITPDTSVTLGYLADVVTSASVDVVSQASPTTIHDTRHQVTTGASHKLGALTIAGGYTYSRENDYLSHSLGVSLALELFDKNTTLSLGYGLGLNTVERADDLNFARTLDVMSATASWTQTVSPRLITQVTYELAHADGYQASPYRFVPVRATVDAAPEYWVPETDPEVRWRHSIVVGANRAVGHDSSLQGDYRLYHDTWGITSHTLGARYFVNLTPRLELRLRERFYTQGAASFYESTYMQAARYITFDRELSPLWSETLGGKLTYGFTHHVEGELKLDAFYFAYSDFRPLASRTGANVGLGLSVTY